MRRLVIILLVAILAVTFFASLAGAGGVITKKARYEGENLTILLYNGRECETARVVIKTSGTTSLAYFSIEVEWDTPSGNHRKKKFSAHPGERYEHEVYICMKGDNPEPGTGILKVTCGWDEVLYLEYAFDGKYIRFGESYKPPPSGPKVDVDVDVKNKVEVNVPERSRDEQPRETSRSAVFNIKSNPSSADLYIDGNWVGNTPAKIELPFGQHKIVVKKKSYKQWEKDLNVAMKGEFTLHAELEKMSQEEVAEKKRLEAEREREKLAEKKRLEAERKRKELAEKKRLEAEKKAKNKRLLAEFGKVIDIDGYFIVSDKGVVLDIASGLMWADKDNGKSVKYYDARRYCEEFECGGYKDWRMPKERELKSLCRGGITSLISIRDNRLWTTDQRKDPNDGEYQYTIVDPNSGKSYWHGGRNYHSVLPVRDARDMASAFKHNEDHWRHKAAEEAEIKGAEREKRYGRQVDQDGTFIKFASGIVLDTKTGFEWVAGPDKKMNWYEAKSWVETLNIDGGGWRMPTREELRTLYTKSATRLFKTAGMWIWSGEKYKNDPGCAWAYNVDSGKSYWGNMATPPFPRAIYKAFAVRSQGD